MLDGYLAHLDHRHLTNRILDTSLRIVHEKGSKTAFHKGAQASSPQEIRKGCTVQVELLVNDFLELVEVDTNVTEAGELGTKRALTKPTIVPSRPPH